MASLGQSVARLDHFKDQFRTVFGAATSVTRMPMWRDVDRLPASPLKPSKPPVPPISVSGSALLRAPDKDSTRGDQ